MSSATKQPPESASAATYRRPSPARWEPSALDEDLGRLASPLRSAPVPLTGRGRARPDNQIHRALLELQRTSGNAAVGRLLASGAAPIRRAPALSAPDYAALAQQVHEALVTFFTDNEAIFVALQKLQKDPAAIAALKQAYKSAYNGDLETELRGWLAGSELDLALDLIGAAKAPMIGAVPSTPAEFSLAARLLFAYTTNAVLPEQVFAVLLPFERDPFKLARLKSTYKTEFGKELDDTLRTRLQGSERAYALYLLNARGPDSPHADATVTAPGKEQHAGKVDGGDVSVRTDVDYATHTAGRSGGFSVGYKGALAGDSRWIQFIWAEVLALQPGGQVKTVPATGLATANGKMDLTTDSDDPQLKIDSYKMSIGPFYEEDLIDVRSATGTTIYDRPDPFDDVIRKQFAAGALWVMERDHFDQFLVRDYSAIYHTSLTAQWFYTSPTAGNRSMMPATGSKVSGLPAAFRKQLIKEYPDYDYIQ